jgi:hypothetical protein
MQPIPAPRVQHPIMLGRGQRTGRHHRQPRRTPTPQSPGRIPSAPRKCSLKWTASAGARRPPVRRRNEPRVVQFTAVALSDGLGATPPHFERGSLAFQRPQGEADPGHDCVPGTFFLLRVGEIKAVNCGVRAGRKVAPAVKDHPVSFQGDGEE